MNARQRAAQLWREAQERASDYWEDRPERVATRRAAFWNLYGRYTAVREQMTQDQQTMRLISSAIGAIGTPLAGTIAFAAMNVDKYIAPAQSRLAGSEETIALMMIEELELDGTLSVREARNMAKATLKAMEEAKTANGNGGSVLSGRALQAVRGASFKGADPVARSTRRKAIPAFASMPRITPGLLPGASAPPAASETEPAKTTGYGWLAIPGALILLAVLR